MVQCTATSKRTHNRCGAQAMTGTNVCYHHGGKAAIANKGARSHFWKDGRYSDSVQGKLLERYQSGQHDTNMMDMRDELTLVRAMTQEALERVDAGHDVRLWGQAAQYLIDMKIATQNRNGDKAREALIRLEDVVAKGNDAAAAHRDARALIQEQVKIVDREQKRLTAMQQLLTVEEASALVSAVILAVTRRVADREVLQQIRDEIELLMGRTTKALSG